MTVPELDLSPPKTHRRAAPINPEVAFVRELGPADLALLASERGTSKGAPPIGALRERHHALARCLARGFSDADASAMTGYSLSTITHLRRDPTFQELFAQYQSIKEFAFADFQERAAAVAIDSLNIIADRLEAAPEEISTSMALEIVKSLADRTGHAPVNKTVNANINVDISAKLAAARQRVSAMRALPEPSGD